jgi:hypothetical protein
VTAEDSEYVSDTLGQDEVYDEIAIGIHEDTEKVLAEVAAIRTVRQLDVRRTSVGDKHLSIIATMPSLRVLYTYDSKITELGLERFRRVRSDVRIIPTDDEKVFLPLVRTPIPHQN